MQQALITYYNDLRDEAMRMARTQPEQHKATWVRMARRYNHAAIEANR